MAALPIFLKDIFYFPGWITGLLGFLYYSYFLIEVGFLKIFYGSRNTQIEERRLELYELNTTSGKDEEAVRVPNETARRLTGSRSITLGSENAANAIQFVK